MKWYKDIPRCKDGFSLEPLFQVLGRIGNPQHDLPPTVHIAGTNGKGSTLAFLKAILKKKDVHRYTSPHIFTLNERIEVKGSPISDSLLTSLYDYAERIEGFAALTPFEKLTLLSFCAFRQEPADFLLLETGMGGLLDATNVINQPLCTAITSISLDHCDFLGKTLREIAYQKAGILKPGIPVVVAPQAPEVMTVITEQAQLLGCPLYRYGEEWRIEKTLSGFIFQTQGKNFNFPPPSLPGRHQYDNAGVAIMIAYNLGIDISLIYQGIETAVWPGRLQQLAPNVWLDGAHNQGGAISLTMEVAHWQQRPVVLIWSMLKGKNPTQFLQAFQHQQDIKIIVVPIEGGHPLPELVACAQAQGFEVFTQSSVANAIRQAQEDFTMASILICGSLYLVKDALTFFKQQELDCAH